MEALEHFETPEGHELESLDLPDGINGAFHLVDLFKRTLRADQLCLQFLELFSSSAGVTQAGYCRVNELNDAGDVPGSPPERHCEILCSQSSSWWPYSASNGVLVLENYW